ncbi:unnamed protein product [Ambrosiozyma monospora]|uniref:Unnamed protein product n=1 Tax=Ambrosiozyma monospora TaxID=43982 RepID=A0ACB5U0Y8_AMBMO|nr:unnamed protein product [Ambrosiozyma monospora]
MDSNLEILQSGKGSGTKVLKIRTVEELKNILGGFGNLVVKEPEFIILKVYGVLDAVNLYFDDESGYWFKINPVTNMCNLG